MPTAGRLTKACATVAASVVIFVACVGSTAPIASPTAPSIPSISASAPGSPSASVEPSSPFETSEPSAAPAEIRLHGTIVGHEDDAPEDQFSARFVADATMDVHLRLSPNRALVEGTVSISGEFTLDCRFSDSGEGVIRWDSDNPRALFVEGQANADVSLFMADPRYFPPGREMELFVLSVGAWIDRPGGTCGYTTSDVKPADPTLLIGGFAGCEMIEVQRVDADTWNGDCLNQEGDSIRTLTARFATEP